MQLSRFLSTAGLGLALSTTVALPVMSMPEMASGDLVLSTDVNGCLALADDFISTLEIQSNRADIARTGYFGDGSFRILCYPNPYATDQTSLAVVFAVHESDVDVANSFVEYALEALSQ